LRDKTSNGHTYYAYGKEAAFDSILYRLLESMPDDLQEKFSIQTNYSQTCCNDQSHNLCHKFRYSVFPISLDDVLDKHFLNSKEFDVFQVLQQTYTTEFYPKVKMLCPATKWLKYM